MSLATTTVPQRRRLSIEVQQNREEEQRASEERRQLERYTSYILNSHKAPLGSLTNEQCGDLVGAARAWLHHMEPNGISLNMAERLFHRLNYEHAAASTSPLWSDRKAARSQDLFHLRLSILEARLGILNRHPKSFLMLQESERAFLSVLQSDDTLDQESFPARALTVLADAWLSHATLQGAEGAANLLMFSTAPSWLPFLEREADAITPFFEKILSQLLSSGRGSSQASKLTSELLQRMDELKEEAAWQSIALSSRTERLLLDASIENVEIYNVDQSSETDQPSLSSFEAAAMEKRMETVLKTAGADDQEEVSRIVERLRQLSEPSEDVFLSLMEYFLRIGDVENASQWIHRVSPEKLFSQDAHKAALLDRILEGWSTQNHQRAPWRAEECVREVMLKTQGEHMLSVDSVNSLMRIWNGSTDRSSNRKVREWFGRMKSMGIKPDVDSLRLLVEATVKHPSEVGQLASHIEEGWPILEGSDKQELAERLLDIAKDEQELPDSLISILALTKKENIGLTPEQYEGTLRKVFRAADPSATLAIVDRLEKSARIPDLDLYRTAIQKLLFFGRDYLEDVESLWRKALLSGGNDPTAQGGFVTAVMAMYCFRKFYGEAELFLLAAEDALLTSDALSSGVSPIPLESYQLTISRKWYTDNNAPKAVESFDKLLSLYLSGYSNLRPSATVYNDYIRAMAVLSDDPKQLVEILDQMLNLMEETEDDALRPDASTFNTILVAFQEDMSDSLDASMTLWKRMGGLGVEPDAKTLGLMIQSAVASNRRGIEIYSIAVKFFNRLGELGFEADSRTLHNMMIAAGNVASGSGGKRTPRQKEGPQKDEEALKLCLRAFGEIRKRNLTSLATYATLTKALRRLLNRGAVADKVAASTLVLCYEDGLLGPQVKEAYQAVMNQRSWKEFYVDRLESDNQEPQEWTRRLNP